MSFLKPRAANLLDLADCAQFLFRKRPLEMDDDAANLLGGDAPKLLARIHVALAALADWNAAAAEAAVRSVAEAAGVKLGAVAQPLRAALNERQKSPGLFDVTELPGRDDRLGRLADRMVLASVKERKKVSRMSNIATVYV